ncbi:MAG: hypothetical protein K2X66_16625 [Cyanobacteria bacterium]|nr:hypothetical protein [Cyanobacteriota bacterium]
MTFPTITKSLPNASYLNIRSLRGNELATPNAEGSPFKNGEVNSLFANNKNAQNQSTQNKFNSIPKQNEIMLMFLLGALGALTGGEGGSKVINLLKELLKALENASASPRNTSASSLPDNTSGEGTSSGVSSNPFQRTSTGGFFPSRGEGNSGSSGGLTPPTPVNPKPSFWENLKTYGKEAIDWGKDKIAGLGHKMKDLLDWRQGDAVNGFRGTCGLVSAANVLTMAGVKMPDDPERYVVNYARNKGYCTTGSSSGKNGGTSFANQARILREHGVGAKSYEGGRGQSAEELAKAVESNKGVILGIDAYSSWNGRGFQRVNHAVTLTGAVRDKETGALKGFTILDSGSRQKSKFLSVAEFKRITGGRDKASCVITDKPLREQKSVA